MSIFIGKFSSSFENGQFDQIKEKCCIGGAEGSRWYNGLSIGDYVFPIRYKVISCLWKMTGYGEKIINGENENVALFDEVKQFNPPLNLDTFIKYKHFNLDINLLNKIKKQTQGYGFHKVDYVKPLEEIEKVSFKDSERRIFIVTENKSLKLKDSDIVVKIDNSELKNIIGFYIFNDNKLLEYKPLMDLYEVRNETKYSLKELLEFSSTVNDNAKKKRNFLNTLINELDTKGYSEVIDPVNLYDNIIVGRKVSPSTKTEDIDDKDDSISNDKDNNSSDSWCDIDINDSTFLGRKRTDYSSFYMGTTIPLRYHEVFLSNLSEELHKGKSIKVKLIINDKIYRGQVVWPASKGRSGVTIQLKYSEKALLELLRTKLEVSYRYIMNYLKEENKKPKDIPDEYKEYIDFYKGDELNTFILKLVNREMIDGIEDEELQIVDENENYDKDNEVINNFIVSELVKDIYNYIKSNGFIYDLELINNIYVSLKTKPFIILSGISGTGKSKLVELFANALGATISNGRFNLIPVKPDWSDSTDILGYRDIEGKFNPGIISKIAYKAMLNPEVPYFICLDEMNLARVEYYFSDILSLIETRRFNDDNEIITNNLLSKEQIGRDAAAISKYGDVYIPQNLYIIGTVNMDETTFPFSKKVLDRANTIEFNEVNLDYSFDDEESIEKPISKVYHNDLLKSEFIKISQCKLYKDIAAKVINDLIDINNVLESHNQHFGYRVRDEIVFYMIYSLRDNLMTYEEAFDYCVTQKILPKISGSSDETLDVLKELFSLFNNYNFRNNDYLDNNVIKAMENSVENSSYKLTNKKLIYMIRRFIRDGFTSFWQ
ncbi:AAA family ATPase [Clostridium sp. AL.422]|uniref:McrB family protein n=1 Tax=Clostridium TaxID=1485 RepID=UPI00293DF207|nr:MULTISPECIES: AAA family ATPase [unclassified Clostridium]MDV4151761.1 AAA family ATPase [Clostridium sp. AL.422]